MKSKVKRSALSVVAVLLIVMGKTTDEQDEIINYFSAVGSI